MNKRVYSLIALLTLMLTICGCSTTASVEKVKLETKGKNIEDVKYEHFEKQDVKGIEKRSPLKDNEESLNNNINQAFKNFTFELMGKEFDMTNNPKVKDLIDLGFNFVHKEVIVNTIKPGDTSFYELMKTESGARISIRMCNTSENIVTYEESEIYSIEVDYSDNMPQFSIVGCDEIALGEFTLSEFDSIFASDTDIVAYDATGYSTRTYEFSNDYYSTNEVKLTFSDGILTSISMRYM